MPDGLNRALQVGLAAALLAGIGAVAGIVWEWAWSPAIGVVVDGSWVPRDATELQEQFAGTGWYVVVAAVAGLIGGLLAALLLPRRPLLTLAGVLVGSVVGAWLMVVIGTAMGPPDPAVLARTATPGTTIPDHLEVTGASSWLAMPVGALLGVAGVFLVWPGRRVDDDADQPVQPV